jgi:hypothetical protein
MQAGLAGMQVGLRPFTSYSIQWNSVRCLLAPVIRFQCAHRKLLRAASIIN